MTPDTLIRAMPGLQPDRARAYQPHNDHAMTEFGITTPARAWMWLAQTGHESASLKHLTELASGDAYEGRRDLGNNQPGDGRRFKGRGPIQITGRYNYTQAARALGVDLITYPERAAKPELAFRISAWWWETNGLNAIADTGDVVAATRKINGGTRGLTDRQQRYVICRNLGNTVLPAATSPPPPQVVSPGPIPHFRAQYISRNINSQHSDVHIWQAKMAARGWTITIDGHYGPQSEAVARQFQAEKNLTADGIIGPDTWKATWTSPVT